MFARLLRAFRRHLLYRPPTHKAVAKRLQAFLSETTDLDSSPIGRDKTILFQGDSITDAHRDRNQNGKHVGRGFGAGYPLLILSKLLSDYPHAGLNAYNLGVSGNKVPDLLLRWQTDCLDLKPDIVSILIGVNDIWHKLQGRYHGTVADYETQLHELLELTRRELPLTRIVLCEPFALRCGFVSDAWYPEITERQAACRRVAKTMNCTFIPFQSEFDDLVQETQATRLASDGIHPTLLGHSLMARTWLETVLGARSGELSQSS